MNFYYIDKLRKTAAQKSLVRLGPTIKDAVDNLNNVGIKTTNEGDQLILPANPLAVPKALFKPDAAGQKVMQTTQQLTQKARAKYHNIPYQINKVYSVPSHIVWNNSIRRLVGKLIQPNIVDPSGNRYKYNGNRLYRLSLGQRAYAPVNNRPGGLYPKNHLGVVLHQTNHYYAPLTNIFSTWDQAGYINPAFQGGDIGASKARDPRRLKPKGYPGYPTQYLPDSYYNSGLQGYTAARSLKQYIAAAAKVASVGLNPDLSDKKLANGTIPFNTAMVKADLWHINPKYTGKINGKKQWQPKYIMSNYLGDNTWHQRVMLPETYKNLQDMGVRIKVLRQSNQMIKHINFMQYLIDLGQRRTPKQTELLKILQKRLPFIMQTAKVPTTSQYMHV